jgi:polyhydroxyalkanoate synthesis regulator phasin
MNEKLEDPFGVAPIIATWMQSMNHYFGGLASQADADRAATAPGSDSAGQTPPKGQAAVAAALKNWQVLAGAMATPDSIRALLKGSGAMPEVLVKLSQTSMDSLIELQQRMIERLGRLGESTKAYQFQDIDENLNRIWTDIYEKEFRQFFHIPQLGLMRTYQVKANLVADNYNRFQSILSEFLGLLGMPFSRSMQVMQEKLGQMAESGELVEDSKFYYNMWVKILEGHFMTLFQTPEYVDTLTRTINALAEFAAARDAALEDLLGSLPLAKKSDVDEMARDLYELKKRVRKLENNQS